MALPPLVFVPSARSALTIAQSLVLSQISVFEAKSENRMSEIQ
jgi:hypothetical protein